MRILLIEDEKITRVTLTDALQKKGHTIVATATGKEGLEAFDRELFDVVITDLKLPSISGLEVLKQVKEKNPAVFVLVMTAYGTVKTAVEALKLGAYDYLTKPFSYEELLIILDKIRDYQTLVTENIRLKQAAARQKQIIGNSPQIRKVLELVETVADSDYSIIIYGETGTGKELVAKAIHEASRRRAKPFVKINCAALSETLLESELFGHEKGAFTGAFKIKIGKFELADGGSIFLDEVDDIPLPMQVKLLRVLQEHQFERVGGEKTLSVDVRVIAASKVDLQEKVKDGSFRPDLFYRLNVVPIQLPPLREHKEDIPLLLEHFIQIFDTNHKIAGTTPELLKKIMAYNWPGNIRELENIVQQMIAFSKGGILDERDLPSQISSISRPPTDFAIANGGAEPIDAEQLLEEFEKKLLLWALEKANSNKTRAAALLNLSRSTFRSKLQKYGLEG